MQNAKSERRFPVRHESEPFRSRRISSPSFVQGCHADLEVRHASGIQLVRGQVLDVSVGGVGALLPLTSQEAKSALSPGATINNLVLEYFGADLYRGGAVVAHSAETGQGLRLGLSLESGSLDLHVLHRQIFRLGFRHKWRRVIDTFSSHKMLPDSTTSVPEGVSREFAGWVEIQQSYFQAVQEFLDTAELDSRREDLVTHHENMEDMLAEASPDFVRGMRLFVEELSRQVVTLPIETRDIHKAHIRSQLGPHLTKGPFFHRAFTKPLGYAGDYEMLNILYRKDADGDNLFARLLSVSAKAEPVGHAVINRLDYLGNIIVDCASRASGNRCRVASIGCGAAQEVWRLLTKNPGLGSRLDITLVDREPRALQYCERTLMPLARQTGALFQFIGDPIQQIIKTDHLGKCLGEQDLIYSAGLFCYLEDVAFVQLAKALYGALNRTGLLVVGNMGMANPTRHYMDFILDWRLNHRSSDDLRRLAGSFQCASDRVEVCCEPLGVNLFLHVRRSGLALIDNAQHT